MRTEAPATYEECAEALRGCSDAGSPVRFVGSGTKLGWGEPVEAEVEIRTEKLGAILEHNAGDLTAVAQAGARLADVQSALAEAGQMIAIDPPGEGATLGGVIATGDSGPQRHRYGTMRDLVLGMSVVLSDGTVARSGGKVIKNVAGYDIAKLLTGAFGTLGMIVEVAVRLHPRPARTVTVRAPGDDLGALGRAAATLSHLPLEMDCLDLAWRDGAGELLARFGGAAPEERADAARRALHGFETSVEKDDDALWAGQRAAQRSADGVVLRVSALQGDAATVLGTGPGVGRAGLGVFYLTLSGDDLVAAIEDVRAELAPRPIVVLDAPEDIRAKVDVWGVPEGGAVGLMRRIKTRFDPAGICNPGLYGRVGERDE